MSDNIRNFSFNLYNAENNENNSTITINQDNIRISGSITGFDLTQYSSEDLVLFRTILTNMIMSNPEMSLDVEKKYKNIISDEGKKKLKTIKYEKNICNPSCPIYYVDFEIGQEITILPCNHGFCSEAINQWLSNEKAECPVCRMEFDSVEVKIKKDNSFINEETVTIAEESELEESESDEEEENVERERLTIHENSPRNDAILNANQNGFLSSIWNLFSQSNDNDTDFQRAIMESYEQT
jgi:hypothetical protein